MSYLYLIIICTFLWYVPFYLVFSGIISILIIGKIQYNRMISFIETEEFVKFINTKPKTSEIESYTKKKFKYDLLARRVFKEGILKIIDGYSELNSSENDCKELYDLDEYTKENILKRYKELAKIYHPDKNQDKEYEELKAITNTFQKVNNCKDRLLKSIS